MDQYKKACVRSLSVLIYYGMRSIESSDTGRRRHRHVSELFSLEITGALEFFGIDCRRVDGQTDRSRMHLKIL